MTALLRMLQRRHHFGVMTKSHVLRALRRVAPDYPVRLFLRRSHLSR